MQRGGPESCRCIFTTEIYAQPNYPLQKAGTWNHGPHFEEEFLKLNIMFFVEVQTLPMLLLQEVFLSDLIGAYKAMVSPFRNDGTKTWKCIFVTYFQNCPVISYGISDSMFSDINCSFFGFTKTSICLQKLMLHSSCFLTCLKSLDFLDFQRWGNDDRPWWERSGGGDIAPKRWLRASGLGETSRNHQSIVAVSTIYGDGMKGFGQVGCLAKWVGPFFLVVEVVDFVQNWLLAELSQLECFWGPILWKSQGVDKSI